MEIQEEQLEEKRTILIVDDEKENLDLLNSTLRKGNVILEAGSGEEALELIQANNIQMVITDHRMPGISGVDLLSMLKKTHPDAIRILITGYTDSKIAVDAINEGEVHRYVKKPWDPKELQNIVKMEQERFELGERAKRLTQDLIRKNEELRKLNEEILEQKHRSERLAAEYKQQKEIALDLSEKYAAANKEILQAHKEIEGKNQKLEQANRKLGRLSVTDGLTGFYNQRQMHTLLDGEIGRAKRYDLNLSIMMVDLDHFKEINDTYGHLVGDQVIRSITSIIRKSIRDTDMPARYGGDEFLVILPHTGQERAVAIAKRIHKDIRAHFFSTKQGKFQQTVSIGIAFYPHEKIKSKEDFIRVVDEALYHAKEKGRNRVVAFQ